MPLQPIQFSAGNVQITLEPPTSLPAIGDALVNNRPFPDEAFVNGAISLGAIGAKASEAFSLGNAKVKFGGGIGGGFGVYRSVSKLQAVLKVKGMDEPMIDRLNFPESSTSDLYAMQWNYNASASVSGEVALGAGVGVAFGASGRHEGFFALVRLIERTAKARDAIEKTLSSWKMPRQVAHANDLEQGTWVIAETEGSMSLSLGVKYGYDYSWMSKELNLGGLSGDLGLKIEMGIGASLGFTASGRFATVLCREGADQKLRLQVFKMRQHGWTFAFDASVSAKKQGSLPPEDFEQFIKSVFNLNDLQVLKDIEKWLDPDTDLHAELGNELVDYLQEMFTELTGVPPAKIDDVIDWLRGPIKKWRDLPSEVAGLVSDLLRKAVQLDELKAFLTQIVALTDNEKLKNEIVSRLLVADFFESTPGRWLTAIAGEGILSMLANIETEREQLKKYAQLTLAVLDGDEVEKNIRKLQDWIEKNLGLDAILAVTDQASFDTIDAWLKKRLSDFLAREVDLSALEEIQKAIKQFRKENVIKEFYDKGLEAISRKYTAELDYAFQKTTTRTALLDLTFDFAADAANAGKYLKEALEGKFQSVLDGQIPGIQLNEASLTHELKRRTYLEVGLPYFQRSVEHITSSLAGGKVVDTAEGRLWILNLQAMDEVTKKHSLSRLSIAIAMTANSGVRAFDSNGFEYDYTLLLAKRNANREYLETRLEDITKEYFPSQFTGTGHGSFSTYLTDLDKALDDRDIVDSDNFGTALTSLQVSLPSSVLAAWKNAPSNPKAPIYFAISIKVQQLLRHWIPRCYIQDTDQYRRSTQIFPLLAYSSLPIIHKIKFAGGEPIITKDAVYDWAFQDEVVRSAVFSKFSRPKMRAILAGIRSELKAAGDDDWVREFQDSQIGTILSLSNDPGTMDKKRDNFEELVDREREMIEAIVKTGTTFRRFLDEDDMEKALEQLAKFGARLTDTFNGKLEGIYTRGSGVRPLGSLMLLEIARIFDPYLDVEPSAMLELLFLTKTSEFERSDFLAGKRPPTSEIALQHRIVNVK